ncbi:hypothetical protein [Kitasatospora sp. NPDC093679]|uniref:hypothetical protein n=1 Tax=Kitasatospora sp. NPDC093679 TaxID=3154983 RepID=UPI0034355EB1
MNEPPHEALVLLAPVEGVLDRLRELVAVTQLGSQRVVLAVVGEGQREKVLALPGVLGVYTDAVPDTARRVFSPGEQLFVSAWEARARPKERPGDGLAWDDPGFRPPDRPTGGPT